MRRTPSALTTTRATFALVVAAALSTGCQSLAEGAKETFSKDNSCPPARVEVRERPELKTSSFGTRAAPPKEIAADPERLKLWQRQQDDSVARSDNGHHFVSVRGCDKSVLYDCRGPTNEDRPQRPWFCSERTSLPDTISVW